MFKDPRLEEDRQRNIAYLNRYGITLKEYRAMHAGQNGVCKICGEPPPKGTRLFVDHDHETKKVRGLLCVGCNAGLGGFKDNTIVMTEAIRYLQRSRGQRYVPPTP